MKYQGTDIHLGLGTHFQRDFEAAHYGKLGDNAAFSIAGFYSGSNGFFKNQTTGNRADNYNEAGGKARFGVKTNRQVHHRLYSRLSVCKPKAPSHMVCLT